MNRSSTKAIVQAGVAVYCEALTDNRNRTAADVRSAFSHANGNLGTSGSVAFQFERKGQIFIEKEIEGGKKEGMIANGAAGDEDEFMMVVAEAGGDDYEDADEEWIVYTAPNDLMAVKKAIEEQGVATKGAEFIMEPTTPTQVSVSDAKKVMRLIDKLEELEIFRTSIIRWRSRTRSLPRSTNRACFRAVHSRANTLSHVKGFCGFTCGNLFRSWLHPLKK